MSIRDLTHFIENFNINDTIIQTPPSINTDQFIDGTVVDPEYFDSIKSVEIKNGIALYTVIINNITYIRGPLDISDNYGTILEMTKKIQILSKYENLALVYSRVSSQQQSDDEFGHISLDTQRDICYDYLKNKQIPVILCIYEVHSARTKPPILDDIVKMINNDKIIIVIHDMSRFSRNTLIGIKLLNDLKSKKIVIHSVTDNHIVSDITSLHRARVGISEAELQSDIISDRVKENIQARRRRGDWIGPPPYGFKCIRNAAGSIKLDIDDDEMGILKLIQTNIHHNSSSQDFKNVTALLNDKGTLKRRRAWNSQKIRRLIRKKIPIMKRLPNGKIITL